MEALMRKYFLLLLVVMLAAPLYAGEEDAILGVWQTDPKAEGGPAHVEMIRDGDTYSGKIIWLSEPTYLPKEGPKWAGKPKVDRENPDPALRSRPILNLEIVGGFHYEGHQKWSGGTIYDPNNGKTYKCWMKLKGQKLKVRGYIGFSLLGRTTVWTRVPEE